MQLALMRFRRVCYNTRIRDNRSTAMRESMELTRRVFLAGAGAMAANGMVSAGTARAARPNDGGQDKPAPPAHDPNLMVFLSDIHQHDNTVRWQDGSTFVGAHHDAREVGIVKEIVTAPSVFGYVFGHEHVWDESFLHYGYGDSRTVQTATLPSGGFWGDIGYALFKTLEDRAELTVRQTDFYFNRRWQDKPRPKNRTERVKSHDGRKVTFWYDKPTNFYG